MKVVFKSVSFKIFVGFMKVFGVIILVEETLLTFDEKASIDFD